MPRRHRGTKNKGTGESEKVKGKNLSQASAAVPFSVPDAPFPCSPLFLPFVLSENPSFSYTSLLKRTRGTEKRQIEGMGNRRGI